MSFYPEPQPVPAQLRADEFVLKPLTTAHVHLDYAALMVILHTVTDCAFIKS
jgi:hypothetical protein